MNAYNQAGINSEKLLDFLNLGTEFLNKHGIINARLNAERLLCHVLHLSRVELYMKFDRPISPTEKDEYRQLLKRRSNFEPLQYIIANTEFYGNTFSVAPGVLIPRPETEELIEKIQESYDGKPYKNALDIGCGSGIIAITLLKEKIAESVTAVDISRDALNITHKNAREILSSDQSALIEERFEMGVKFIEEESKNTVLTLLKADAFSTDFLPDARPFDLIVSNPPYVTEKEWLNLDKEVRDFEPKLALTSGDEGLDSYRFLATHLKHLLSDNGIFWGEFGAEQGKVIKEIFEEYFNSVKIYKDLNARDRIISASDMRRK